MIRRNRIAHVDSIILPPKLAHVLMGNGANGQYVTILINVKMAISNNSPVELTKMATKNAYVPMDNGEVGQLAPIVTNASVVPSSINPVA